MNEKVLKAARAQTNEKLAPLLKVIAEIEKPKTEDEAVFGKDQWIYCRQHLRPHLTGWCTVPVSEKIGLGVNNTPDSDKEAFKKCRNWGFKIY